MTGNQQQRRDGENDGRRRGDERIGWPPPLADDLNNEKKEAGKIQQCAGPAQCEKHVEKGAVDKLFGDDPSQSLPDRLCQHCLQAPFINVQTFEQAAVFFEIGEVSKRADKMPANGSLSEREKSAAANAARTAIDRDLRLPSDRNMRNVAPINSAPQAERASVNRSAIEPRPIAATRRNPRAFSSRIKPAIRYIDNVPGEFIVLQTRIPRGSGLPKLFTPASINQWRSQDGASRY